MGLRLYDAMLRFALDIKVKAEARAPEVSPPRKPLEMRFGVNDVPLSEFRNSVTKELMTTPIHVFVFKFWLESATG